MLKTKERQALQEMGFDPATVAKLHAMGFNWSQLIVILQAILSAVLNNLPTPPAPPPAPTPSPSPAPDSNA